MVPQNQGGGGVHNGAGGNGHGGGRGGAGRGVAIALGPNGHVGSYCK